MGIKSRRVAFTFDDSSIKTLEEVREYGVSVSEVLRESPQITRALELNRATERLVAQPRRGRLAYPDTSKWINCGLCGETRQIIPEGYRAGKPAAQDFEQQARRQHWTSTRARGWICRACATKGAST